MTQNISEFNSEYCNLKYVEQDNVVLLVWKKFCCFEDYRQPTMYAANLLHKHNGSNFVIDARNGFEDDKADVEWGFSVLQTEFSFVYSAKENAVYYCYNHEFDNMKKYQVG